MTSQALNQLYYLRREVKMWRKHLEELDAQIRRTPARARAMLADTRGIVEVRLHRCAEEMGELEQYIADIPDDFTRRVFAYRFMDGLSWIQVADRLGGWNSEENLRKIASRYMKRH